MGGLEGATGQGKGPTRGRGLILHRSRSSYDGLALPRAPKTPPKAPERLPDLQASLAAVADELLTPALVIDLDAVDHNVATLAKKLGGVSRWRPHIKTIKQARLIRMLMEGGTRTLKCATIDELALALDTAERVHPEGHVDVLLAYPIAGNAIRAVVELMRDYEGGSVTLLADSPEHLQALSAGLVDAGARHKLPVLLEVDTGMHRTGTAPKRWTEALKKKGTLEHKKLEVVGLHGYEGHLGWDDRERAFEGYDALVELARALPPKQCKSIVTSGSHAFVHALQHPGLQEGSWHHQVSPGTLVLSDVRSAPAAKALDLRQAVFVVSRVISAPTPEQITVDAGSKAMDPDVSPPQCEVLGHPQLQPLTASEEHRPMRLAGKGKPPEVGELVWLMPAHACTTVNLHRSVLYVRGGKLVKRGTIEATGHTLYVSDRRP